MKKRLQERDIPWWWYWLHPIDALEISHYGYMDIITDKSIKNVSKPD